MLHLSIKQEANVEVEEGVLFPLQDQIATILDLVSQVVFIVATELYHHNAKAAIKST